MLVLLQLLLGFVALLQLAVKFNSQCLRFFVQGFKFRFHFFKVTWFLSFLKIIKSRLSCVTSCIVPFPSVSLMVFFSRKDSLVYFVTKVNFFFTFLICFSVCFASFIMRSISSVCQTWVWLDNNCLFFLSSKIFRLNRYDTVLIDVKCNFDLWDTTAAGISVNWKRPCYLLPLGVPLKNMDINGWLVICRSWRRLMI